MFDMKQVTIVEDGYHYSVHWLVKRNSWQHAPARGLRSAADAGGPRSLLAAHCPSMSSTILTHVKLHSPELKNQWKAFIVHSLSESESSAIYRTASLIELLDTTTSLLCCVLLALSI